jgi:hypothetical protein
MRPDINAARLTARPAAMYKRSQFRGLAGKKNEKRNNNNFKSCRE